MAGSSTAESYGSRLLPRLHKCNDEPEPAFVFANSTSHIVLAKFKQPNVAIDVAKRAGAPVDIMGGDHFVEEG